MNPAFPDRINIADSYMRGRERVVITGAPFRQVSSLGTITVPAGFHSDGASIPKVFHSIIHPFGQYFEAALIHDFLYVRQGHRHYPHLTRKDADTIFLEGMYNLGVPWRHRHPMHLAVRSFGWRSYQKK